MLDKSIFKAYDVRGTYPDQLTYQVAFEVGAAFIKKTGVKNVVIGHDARLSSPELHQGLAAGLLAAGATVTTIGQTPTEGLYFAAASYDFDSGIMITASHNPKEYNGFKMMTREGSDIQWIRGTDLQDVFEEVEVQPQSLEIPTKDIWPDFINHIFSLVDVSGVKKMKVVVDASNGVIGDIIEKMSGRLPMEVIPLNFTADGNFPAHGPNPRVAGAADQIKEVILREKADFGLLFDGDADRIFLVDEQGKLVEGEATLLLLAKQFLQTNPGMGIAYNAVCSKAVPEFVSKWGGVPIRTQVGFVNVREGLLKHNGVMGGETSCHYCFKEYFYMDSGQVAMLSLLKLIASEGRNVSDMVAEVFPYAKSDEMNFTVENKEAMLEKVKERYSDGSQDFLDGVTVSYKDWWFNVRPSNTEPVLRLTVEADTQELLEAKKKELVALLTQV
jgi:phosphomannomutase